MATRQETADYLIEQMARAGSVSARRMFGEYAVYCNGRVVALICDDQLYIKPTVAGRAHAGAVPEAPPYPGARPHLQIPGDRWEDDEWMARLARLTADELPLPAKAKAKAKAKPKASRRTAPRR